MTLWRAAFLLLFFATSATAQTPPSDTFGDAMRWYFRAAEVGETRAQFLLAVRYEQGIAVDRDDAKAAHWFGRAAGAGDARAQFKLALMLEQGRGVARDRAAALAMYERAARQGLAAAQYNLGVALLAAPDSAQRHEVQAFAWIELAARSGLAPAADFRDRLVEEFPDVVVDAGRKLAAEFVDQR